MLELKMIYVDDEASAIKNFQYVVENCPIIAELRTFKTPEEAIVHVQENQVDMAFLDVDLGQMNGFELCEKLRDICPNLPVASVTGNIAYMRRSNRIIKAPYIFKPYNLHDILDAIPKDVQ